MNVKTILSRGFASILMGACAVALAQDNSRKPSQAIVRAVHGAATYSVNGGAALPLRTEMKLEEDTQIETAKDAWVDLQVNGKTSVVRVQPETKVVLKTMEELGGGDETMLDVKNGTIYGFVKKIAKDSKYEVNTPRGVMGLRGTDFSVKVLQNPDGTYNVTFNCFKGQIFVVANFNIDGVPLAVPITLNSGECYTPPPAASDLSSPLPPARGPIPEDVMAEYHRIAKDLELILRQSVDGYVAKIPSTPPSVYDGTPGAAGGGLPDVMKVNVRANHEQSEQIPIPVISTRPGPPVSLVGRGH